jgi:hypothetical protein
VKLMGHCKILRDNIHGKLGKLVTDQMPTPEWMKLMRHCKILRDNIHDKLVKDCMPTQEWVKILRDNIHGKLFHYGSDAHSIDISTIATPRIG